MGLGREVAELNYKKQQRTRQAREDLLTRLRQEILPDSWGLGREVAELNYKKQQRTGQAPGGFTDAPAAGNSPRFMGGLGGKLRN